MKNFFAFIFLLISFCAQAQIDKVVPASPNPPKLVNDFANVLTEEQEHALENKLVAYDDSTSSQLVVVTIKSLEGYDISEYALALGRKWGVGGKEFNNGVVVLVSIDDHKARIEVGYGLEGAIPDITAKSILDNAIIPNFKKQDYYRGLDQAADLVFKAAAGEYKAPQGYGKSKAPKGIGFGAIILFIIILFLFSGRGGRGGRGGGMISRRGYGDIGAGWIIGSLLGGAGRSGGGWSGGDSGGGGGFGGFGGGSFGGGGASGSW
jgi:uncharacterized protein